MSSISISVVIPIIPKHHRYLPSLILNLASGSVQPTEIIISGSSQTPESCEYLNQIATSSPTPIKIVTSPELLPPGSNRNTGWEIASSDYVTFCDADDTYSRTRLEVLQSIAYATDADLILHNYSRLKPRWYLDILPRSNNLLSEKEIYSSTFPNGLRLVESELGISGDTNLLLPKGSCKSWRIPHGHATVKRNLASRYGLKFSGEDGQFCRDILFNGKRVIYTPTKLSNYDRPTLENIVAMSASRIHADLARTKNHILAILKTRT
jgi:glycosyltransferase involved in cell wall biosynthesis